MIIQVAKFVLVQLICKICSFIKKNNQSCQSETSLLTLRKIKYNINKTDKCLGNKKRTQI